MFVVLCALNMRSNIGIAMVCMVNSTAYSTKSYENASFSFSASESSTCQKVKNSEKDLGYQVDLYCLS